MTLPGPFRQAHLLTSLRLPTAAPASQSHHDEPRRLKHLASDRDTQSRLTSGSDRNSGPDRMERLRQQWYRSAEAEGEWYFNEGSWPLELPEYDQRESRPRSSRKPPSEIKASKRESTGVDDDTLELLARAESRLSEVEASGNASSRMDDRTRIWEFLAAKHVKGWTALRHDEDRQGIFECQAIGKEYQKGLTKPKGQDNSS